MASDIIFNWITAKDIDDALVLEQQSETLHPLFSPSSHLAQVTLPMKQPVWNHSSNRTVYTALFTSYASFQSPTGSGWRSFPWGLLTHWLFVAPADWLRLLNAVPGRIPYAGIDVDSHSLWLFSLHSLGLRVAGAQKERRRFESSSGVSV